MVEAQLRPLRGYRLVASKEKLWLKLLERIVTGVEHSKSLFTDLKKVKNYIAPHTVPDDPQGSTAPTAAAAAYRAYRCGRK